MAGPFYFLEFNEYSIVAARASGEKRPLIIEDIRETANDNPTGVAVMLAAVFSTGASKPVCLIRATDRFFHLAAAAETQKVKGAAALEEFLKQSPHASRLPAYIAWVMAQGGGAAASEPAGAPWIIAGTPSVTIKAVEDKLRELNVVPGRLESASIATIGGVANSLKVRNSADSAVIWDISAASSQIFAVRAGALQGTQAIQVGLDQVIEAIQTELNLKFKGSATKLLFNEFYDFSEIGPKIAGRISPSLKEAIGRLGFAAPPKRLHIAGLPAKQSWIGQHFAPSLGLSLLDLPASASGISFANAELSEGLPAAWVGLVDTIASFDPQNPNQDRPWHVLLASSADIKTAVSAPPTPAVFIDPPKPPAAKPTVLPPPPPAPAQRPVTLPPRAEPAKAQPIAPKTQPAPQKQPEAAKPKPLPTPPAPPPAKRAEVPKVASSPASGAEKKNSLLPVIIAVLLVILVAGGAYIFYARKNADTEAQIARVRADAIAEATKKAQAEQALRDAETQKKLDEASAGRKAAEAQAASEVAARKQAEDKAAKEAEARRLGAARGLIAIKTTPPGAKVSISGLGTQTTPAEYREVRLGNYSATISADGYDDKSVDLSVKENETADPGVIALVRSSGTVEVNAEPATGVDYLITPEGSFSITIGNNPLAGKAPGSTAVPTGKYTVTVRRNGWPEYKQNILVEKGATARVSAKFPGAKITVTSNPAKARVLLNGVSLGETPLVLDDHPPGDVHYQLLLPQYDPLEIFGTAEAGKTLTLGATLERIDRLARPSEVDVKPEPLTTVSPTLTAAQESTPATIVIGLTVDSDGNPKDLRIEKAPDKDLGDRCLEAASQWKFKPALQKGKPVSVRVSLPFAIRP